MGSVHSLVEKDKFVYTDDTAIYLCDQRSIQKVKLFESLAIYALIPLKRDQTLWAVHSECRIRLFDGNFQRLSIPEIIGHSLTSVGCRIFLPSSCFVTSPDKTLFIVANYWSSHMLIFDWNLICTSSDAVIDINHASFVTLWTHEEVVHPRSLLQDTLNPSLFWIGSDKFLGLFDANLNLIESHVLDGKPKELIFHEDTLWVLLCNDEGFWIVNGRTGKVLRQAVPSQSFDFFSSSHMSKGLLLKENGHVRVDEEGGFIYTLKGTKGLGKAQRVALMDGQAECPCSLSKNISSLSIDLIRTIMSYL